MKRCYDFGDDQLAAIDGLAKELGTTKTEILTNGLRLLRIAVRETRQGRCLGIVSGSAVVSELVGVWSDAIPHPSSGVLPVGV